MARSAGSPRGQGCRAPGPFHLFGALDAKVREDLRSWLRRLHDEVHVTTVLVTHDQEEAMDVADRIAVMSEGRIEQIGSPRDLYDRPATAFVMSFLGPTATLRGEVVRPHDLVLSLDRIDDGVAVVVERVVHLGFEVRVELRDETGESVTAQTTRGEAAELALHPGQALFVRTGWPDEIPVL